MRFAPLAALTVVLAACARPAPSSAPNEPPPLVKATTVSSVTPAIESTEAATPPPPGPWRDLVRAERWREAAEQLDSLPQQDRDRPEMRLVRARIAAELRDHASAVKLLDGLEKDLPSLAELIGRRRAESQIETGDEADAAAWLAKKSGLRVLTKAALAYEKAGKTDEARRTIDRALASAKGGSGEAEARAVRMRLAEATQKEIAGADAKWILLHVPESTAAKPAAETIARLEPSWKPSPDEELVRADKLSAAGKLDAALDAIEAAAKGRGAPPKSVLLHARGLALYKARHYREAAHVLAQAAAAKSPTADDDAFHAARALSRADEDEEAIRAYRAFAKKSPKSPLAEEASYLAARLAMLLGKNDEAAKAYAAYFRANKGGKHAEEATYELALVDLAEKRFERARKAFASLARGEESRAERARLRELEGAAARKAGDEAGARSALSDVVKTAPLSWAALAAEAHLREMKAEVPPIEPAEAAAATPFEPKLPIPVQILHQVALDDDAEDALRALEAEVQNAHPGRGVEALCRAYGALDHATRRYRIAQDRVKADVLAREPSEATRWAWDCLYPRPYEDVVRAAESRESLPRGLIYAVMRQESAFDPDVVSGAHAVGLLQLLPVTAKTLATRAGVPFEDGSLVRPPVNIDLGARYLAMLTRTWKGQLPLAIASYNAGPKAVSKWLEHAEGLDVDVFVARIPYGETRAYVSRVMGNLARYAYLMDGLEAVPRVTLALDASLRAGDDAF